VCGGGGGGCGVRGSLLSRTKTTLMLTRRTHARLYTHTHPHIHPMHPHRCNKEFEKWQEQGIQGVPAAACIAGACNYGFGTLHVLLGSLPPTVLTLVGFLGMKADVDTGLAMLVRSSILGKMFCARGCPSLLHLLLAWSQVACDLIIECTCC
jgi:hypothetical protein